MVEEPLHHTGVAGGRPLGTVQLLATDPFPEVLTRGGGADGLAPHAFHQSRDHLEGLGLDQFICILRQPLPLQGDGQGFGAISDLGAAHDKAPLMVTEGGVEIPGTGTLVDAGHAANKSANVLGVNDVLLCTFPQ